MAAATARYARLPDEGYMREWGMPAEHIADTYRVEVWPENWPAWCLFDALATQWRTGMGGVIGLDYNVLEHMLHRIPLEQRDQLRHDIRVLEAAALHAIYETTEYN